MYLQLLGPVPSIHETVMFMTRMMNFFLPPKTANA